ncbi:hypothetical protein V1525DRAFT_414334 [Lipomyces kononenkoae]|uniref:Uncharacterized protein n=1 Tax=Lipomyces kononenkoae TaxID=34357 RepID=A0ACC3SR11_LIPKO
MEERSEYPPEPQLVDLFIEFLRHVPSFDGRNQNDSSDDHLSLTPTLSPSFLSQLNPLLRARLTFNIQAFSLGDSDNSSVNFDNDRIIETVRHQWAELLSWPNPSEGSALPELGPILARKLYDSRDLLLNDTPSQDTENDSDGGNTKVNIKGYAMPDVETFLACAWLPATGVEIVWDWEKAERAWRVHEVKLSIVGSSADGFGDLDYLQVSQSKSWAIKMNEAVTGVHGLKVNEQGKEVDDSDDDSYWGEYDKNLDDKSENEEVMHVQEPHPKEVGDHDYYSRYDAVTTALSGDSSPRQDTTGMSPVHIHIMNSLRSLRDLARGSGMAHEEFMYLISESLRDSG